MDVWDANSISSAFTSHPCLVSQQTRCSGAQCINNLCDSDGCDFNSFRLGEKGFYGKNMELNTDQRFTVVTQFISSDNTTTGTLSEIRRLYIQNGQIIQNSKVNVPGIDSTTDSITDTYCEEQELAFNNTNTFRQPGGLAHVRSNMAKGMVMVMSIWNDHDGNMLWLDSNYPADGNSSEPGVSRGTCPVSSGKPQSIEITEINAMVTFSDIRFGDIGSTF
ncbi:hypothetical protein NP233_g6961 [Leucocoprinus birnbaumii]|uniref:cellulase n=1 Tax=Leucocoprinus birnbaumii TaxID=56174 RepID=A0AAD5VQA0_9AGAR|nr:hypothetical protein NP233_g6961 [Leucocoprinus birnbaumii]